MQSVFFTGIYKFGELPYTVIKRHMHSLSKQHNFNIKQVCFDL